MRARDPLVDGNRWLSRLLGVAVLCAWVAGCSIVSQRPVQAPSPRPATPETADAIPRQEPPSRYGNPDTYEVFGKRYRTLKTSAGFRERGVASWYGSKFHGRRTSSGEQYDMYRMTAAHKALPLPSYVEVRNLENGRRVTVRVNDRGPFHDNRIIDLSYAAALKLGIVKEGTAFVEVVALDGETEQPSGSVVAANSAPPTPEVFLQIGAFAERPNAERLSRAVEQLVSDGVRVTEAQRGDAPIYRVQVGPIATVDSADRIVAALFDLGIDQHHFVSP